MSDAESPQETGPREPVSRLDLRRPPFWSTGLVVLVTVLGVVGFTVMTAVVGALQAGEPPADLVGPALILLGCLAGVGAGVGYRFWVRSHPMPGVVFHPEAIELPGHLEATKPTRVPYNKIISVGIAGRPGATLLLIETQRSVFLFPFELFVDEEGAKSLADELHRRVKSLPEGPKLMEMARRRRELAERALAIRPIATQALIGVLGVLFANQMLTGGLDSPLGLVRWGANVPVLVQEGQSFRLVTASFLHAHLPHILLNGLALYYLGRLMERFLGSVRFLVLYLLSGLAATLASTYLSGATLSLGASGSIFGLFGGLAWVNWRYRAELPLGLRQPLRVWVIIGVANVLLVLVVPLLGLGQIDVAAHVAGLVAGVAIGAYFARGELDVGVPTTQLTRAVALFLVFIHGVAMTEGVIYAANFDDEHREAAAEAMLSDADADAMTLNNLAWILAIDPRTSEPTMASVEVAARRAVELEPEQGAYRDTLATVLYRRGFLDDAVDEERRAFASRSDELMASQLARFLSARLERDGPMFLGGAGPVMAESDGTRSNSVSIELDGADELGEPTALLVRLGSPFAKGVTVFATLRRGDQHLGLLHVVLGANPESEHRFEIGDGVGESLAGARIRLEVALVDGNPVTGVELGKVRWKLWDHDAEVDELP